MHRVLQTGEDDVSCQRALIFVDTSIIENLLKMMRQWHIITQPSVFNLYKMGSNNREKKKKSNLLIEKIA